jgi:hypothetical protein
VKKGQASKDLFVGTVNFRGGVSKHVQKSPHLETSSVNSRREQTIGPGMEAQMAPCLGSVRDTGIAEEACSAARTFFVHLTT